MWVYLSGSVISAQIYNPVIPADQYKYFVNSADSDETARDEPSHQDLDCFQFCYWFMTETPICINRFVQIQ